MGIISFVALIGMIAVYLLLQEIFAPEYKKYTEDHFHGVKWRWSWSGREISNLWCYCPSCDGELVYNDTSRFSFEESETKFICEHCNNREVTTIKGGDNFYAKNAVKREIRRKISTNEKKL